MSFIKIQKSELEELEKKCKDQENQIREQDALIERLSFEVDVFDGWRIQHSQNYYTLEVEYRKFLIKHTESLEALRTSAKLITSHETILMELQQDCKIAKEHLIETENAWKVFASKYPEAAEAVLHRHDTPKKAS